MNWVDLILLAILIAGLWRGMLQGFGRQLLGLLSLCLAGALAFLLYPDLAALLRPILQGIPRQGREMAAFLFVFIALSNMINYAVHSGTPPPEERRCEEYRAEDSLEAALERGFDRFVLAPLSMLGSLALALIVTCIWLGVATNVLRLALAVPWLGYDEVRSVLYRGLVGSSLVGWFDSALLLAYAYTDGWASDAKNLLASLSVR